MNLLKAKLDLYPQFDNCPSIKVLVDKMPDIKDLRYKSKNGIYYAELDDYVSFYYYKKPDQGYGGRTFNITMTDGNKKALKGPWSSNSTAVNRYFGPCHEITITEESTVWQKGHTFYAAACTVDFWKQAVKLCGASLGIQYTNSSTEMSSEQNNIMGLGTTPDYVIVPPCNDCNDPKTLKYRIVDEKDRKYLCESCVKNYKVQDKNPISYRIEEYTND